MTPDHKIQVGMLDDHQIVLEGLGLLIKSADDIECAFTVSSARDAFIQLRQTPVDVLLLDIELADADGIAVCRQIKSDNPAIKVVALTMYNELTMIRQMIEAGADGYLLKNVSRDELLNAIRRVYAGKNHYSPEIAEILIRENQKEKSKPTVLPSLSVREKQIVRLIMEELTSPQIAEKLNISLNTVETHRRNIMSKLNTKNSAGIVRMVIENGLLKEENRRDAR